MTLIKGRYVDKTTRIQSDSNPVESDDLSRKLYIDGLLSNKVSTDALGVTVATLDGSGKVPSSQLPGFVDDVLEYADFASFPATGETGKLYVTIDTNKVYRWTGSLYVEITGSPGSTDAIPEGTVNLYYTDERAANAAPVQSVSGKVGDVLLDKADVGLSNVDDTADLDKPISTATQTALDGKFDNPTGDTTQYIAGDGSLLAFPTVMQADKVIATVYNKSGAAIPKGSVVYIDGVHGNKPTVALGQANSESSSSKVFGVAVNEIADNSLGTVIDFGLLVGIPTNSFAEGDALWLSPSVPGGFTKVKPSAPDHLVFIGIVTRAHPVLGEIQIKIQNGFEIEELHDVSIASLADGQILKYDLATDLWKNHTQTKADVGLDQVDNTSDLDKPVSTATATALAGKAASSHTHLMAEITDLAFPVDSVSGKTGAVSLEKGDVGLAEVDNTSDLDKPISTAVSLALSNKAGLSHTHLAADITDFASAASLAAPVQSINGKTGDLFLEKSDVNLDQVDNTSDENKPISSATQLALDAKQDSLGTGTVSQFLRGDLTWQAIPSDAPYVAELVWNGSGPYSMTVLAATHGKGTDPIVAVRELSGGSYLDKTYGYLGQEMQISVNTSGDVTATYSTTFSGKIIIK